MLVPRTIPVHKKLVVPTNRITYVCYICGSSHNTCWTWRENISLRSREAIDGVPKMPSPLRWHPTRNSTLVAMLWPKPTCFEYGWATASTVACWCCWFGSDNPPWKSHSARGSDGADIVIPIYSSVSNTPNAFGGSWVDKRWAKQSNPTFQPKMDIIQLYTRNLT